MEVMMSEFQARVGPRARKNRTPVTCLFEITPTCNLRCHFCYVALDPYKGPYLSTAQVCEVIDRVERSGVLWLTLTGGEIFSRRDFPEIYRHARSKGLLVTLFTNATMTTEKIANLLAELPPFAVEVSIYGATADVYEGTTGIPGSFARFERGLNLLLGARVKPLLKTPVSSLSVQNIQDIIAYAKARELALNIDPLIDRRHSGGEEPMVYRIESKRVNEIRRFVRSVAEDGASRNGPVPECAIGPEPGAPQELYTCGAGRTHFFIDALGNMSHCVIDRDPTFPVLDMEFDDIWGRMGTWVTQPLPQEASCSGCGMRHSCSNCPARSRLSTGSSYLKDTYYCDVTHDRFGLAPAEHPDYHQQTRDLGFCVK